MLHIDTNLINARQKLDAVNRLEKWQEDGVVLINMSSTAHAEAKAGNDELRARKANQQIFTVTQPGDSTDRIYRMIESALFLDGAKDENQRNDVRIVFEAAKYGATLDHRRWWIQGAARRDTGNREKLKDLVRIVSRMSRGARAREDPGSVTNSMRALSGNTAANFLLGRELTNNGARSRQSNLVVASYAVDLPFG